MTTPLRVLFVHGLESGPRGRKARALQEAGFVVVAEAMPCSQRSMARDPGTIGALLVALLTMFVGIRWGWIGALSAASLVLLSTPIAMRLIVRRAFRKSVLVQRNALQAHAIDVVLGSSYGGAVAIELLRLGAWKGPTVLLCPAHRLVARRASLVTPKLSDGAHVVVVHGTKDETVPIEDSRALIHSTRATLIQVDDDHRLKESATPSQLAHWIELAVQNESARHNDLRHEMPLH